MEEVILVDLNDVTIGSMEKIAAHQSKNLHRAFSIFLFDDKSRMLLQKRAETKYHSPNLWTNACCSHPRPGENLIDAAKRRLKEELNIDTECELVNRFSFVYDCEFDNGLFEHEYDHVFFGRINAIPEPNLEEVSTCKFSSFNELDQMLELYPAQFTYWFKECYERVKREWFEYVVE